MFRVVAWRPRPVASSAIRSRLTPLKEGWRSSPLALVLARYSTSTSTRGSTHLALGLSIFCASGLTRVCCSGDIFRLVAPVVAAPGQDLRLMLPEAELEAVTVELDFMDPVISVRRTVAKLGKERLDELWHPSGFCEFELTQHGFRGWIDALDRLPL